MRAADCKPFAGKTEVFSTVLDTRQSPGVSACQKSLAEFAARRRQRDEIIFSRDMCVRENTAQAASVEFRRFTPELCAQQTAILLSEKPGGFFDSLRHPGRNTARMPFCLHARRSDAGVDFFQITEGKVVGFSAGSCIMG